MVFASREEAGERLGLYLKGQALRADLVLGLPRGGVVVAAGVARILGVSLDVLIVRKLGHPLHREFAVGALAENDVVVLDQASLRLSPVNRSEWDAVVAEENRRLQSYQLKFHASGTPNLEGKRVILVDDGLATGATAEAAVCCALKRKAQSVMVATPVASTHAYDRLAQIADSVLALEVDPEFGAVGRYYRQFSQTTDEEVLTLLRAG